MNELAWLSLCEAAELIRRGELSPLELTRACLERIERLDGRLNSFITLTAEAALQRAASAEKAQQRGEEVGPLHGIPLALKDLYETQGVRTTGGSSFFTGYVPQASAAAVEKLEAAGAVLLGKLNMHEIALGLTNVNPHYGACHNPWALERVPGGSSGGSGAALAAGLCLGSLGSDTGGSIRVPASLCGVVGLKPTYGRVSLRGVMPLSWNLDHAGPMARCVQDAAVLLQAIAGYDSDDPASIDAPVDDYLGQLKDGVSGWRLALADDEFFDQANDEVLQAVRQAAQVFAQLGAQVEAVPVPGARQAAQANGLVVVSDAAALHQERLAEHPQGFGADVLARLRMGAAYTSSEYALARRTQVEARRQFERFFERYDLLLAPATAIPAPPIEGPDAVAQAHLLTRFTAPFNLTGLPAISLPCGFTAAGLPLGLQIVAPAWAEARLLRAAYAYEQATPWNQRRPAL
ncbi:MAG: amidase [Chloroflexota bacterium]